MTPKKAIVFVALVCLLIALSVLILFGFTNGKSDQSSDKPRSSIATGKSDTSVLVLPRPTAASHPNLALAHTAEWRRELDEINRSLNGDTKFQALVKLGYRVIDSGDAQKALELFDSLEYGDVRTIVGSKLADFLAHHDRKLLRDWLTRLPKDQSSTMMFISAGQNLAGIDEEAALHFAAEFDDWSVGREKLWAGVIDGISTRDSNRGIDLYIGEIVRKGASQDLIDGALLTLSKAVRDVEACKRLAGIILDPALASDLKPQALEALANSWAQRDPVGLTGYLDSLPDTTPGKSEMVGKLVDRWYASDPMKLSEWVSKTKGNTALAAITQMSENLSAQHPDEAIEWAVTLPMDHFKRRAIIQNASSSLAATDKAALVRIAGSSRLSDAERRYIASLLK